MPETTVLIPTYNCGKYIEQALSSVLRQQYQDFEILVVDDGSTDDSFDIIQKFRGQKLRYYKNDHNMGIVYSLNKGLELANGKYIARMDADDIMLRDRLGLQITFLRNNPDFGMVGGWYDTIDAKGKTIYSRQTLTQQDILPLALIFRNQFAHSSVTMRKDIAIRLGYDSQFQYCEDHDLWIRLSAASKVTNIPHFCTSYRWHSENTCNTHQKEMKNSVLTLLSRELDKIEVFHSVEELKIHASLCFGLATRLYSGVPAASQLESWVSKVLSSPVLRKRYKSDWLANFRAEFAANVLS